MNFDLHCILFFILQETIIIRLMKRFLFLIPFLLAFTCNDRNDEQTTECIDYESIDETAMCTEEYMPVCGCNLVTYSNPCKATNAGVQSFTKGACSSIEVEKEFNLWNSMGIQSYSFYLMVSCYCLITEPYSITVVDGEPTSITGNEAWGHEGIPLTIEELFVKIKDLLSQDPFDYNLAFDKEYGYPTSVYFDMDEQIADEEIGYTVENFQVLTD